MRRLERRGLATASCATLALVACKSRGTESTVMAAEVPSALKAFRQSYATLASTGQRPYFKPSLALLGSKEPAGNENGDAFAHQLAQH